MSALAKPAKMTLADFLAWENEQPERHEFIDGEIFAMVGASVAHGILASNLHVALRQSLKVPGCRVFQEGYKVLAREKCFYPDVVVACGPFRQNDLQLDRPVLLAEVISPSGEQYDRLMKWDHYRQGLPTLQAYVLVAQDRVRVEVYVRERDGWHYSEHTAFTDTIQLTSPPCQFSIAELYEGTVHDRNEV